MPAINAPYLIYLGDTKIAGLAKTGLGLAYWRPDRCLAQFREPDCAADLDLPDMSIEAAVAAGAKTLVIGTAIIGGQLPTSWVSRLVEAMEAGLDIASGLHTSLKDIQALSEVAERTGRKLHDVRLAKGNYPIATGLPRSGNRMLMLGTDCAVGKKYTALAIHKEMVAQGMNSTFRATGQTGVLIDGTGISVDAIVSDFLAGAVEQLTPEAPTDHWDVIEGQGSLIHPAFAGVSLGLLHGSQPNAFVVCHEANRENLSGFPGHKTGGIAEIIDLTTRLCRHLSPDIRCVGLSINTSKLAEGAAKGMLRELSEEHQIPACDPVRFGVSEIVSAL